MDFVIANVVTKTPLLIWLVVGFSLLLDFVTTQAELGK
jgi:hypothetical protein